MSLQFSRRQFLKLSSSATGGLVLGLHLHAFANTDQDKIASPWIFIDIAQNGLTTIGARGAEIGQGVKTSLPMLIAEELDVAWSAVKVVQLPHVSIAKDDKHESKYGGQGVGGSTSVSSSFSELRTVGAVARNLLVEAAAQKWQIGADELTTSEGHVIHPNGDKLSYGQVAAAASTLPLPTEAPKLKTADQFTIIGTPTQVVDTKEIVTGRGYYGIDAKLPGSLTAVVARCPYFQGDVKRFNQEEIRKMPGVRHVVKIPPISIEDGVLTNMAAGVAIVADDTWAALKAKRALKIEWTGSQWSDDSTEKLHERALKALDGEGHVNRVDGDINQLDEDAHHHVTADYTMPFLAHSTMEPQNALVDIKHNHVTVIASIQLPGSTARMVSGLTGIDLANIDVEMPRSGGGFGRRLETDFIAEAVQIAQVTETPIKLIWTREDDMQNDYFRPYGVHRFDTLLDQDNRISAWSHKIASTGKRFMQPRFEKAPAWLAVQEPDQFPAGCVEHYQSEFMQLDFGLLCGWWRAPAPTFLAFPVQSFIDEVAVAAKRDPVELRLELLGEPRQLEYRDHGGPVFDTGRLAAVTSEAAKLIDHKRKLRKGRGIGIASHFVFGGYVAHAMEVSVEKGKPVIHRCVCAVDIGQVVNPLGAEAQISGGTIDGLSSALSLEITVRDGKIEQSNFPNYRLLQMADAPDVEVYLMESDQPPAGCGEMGIPTAAPALCNAIFAATGKRIRKLPIGRQLV